jgi:hypothetical protein
MALPVCECGCDCFLKCFLLTNISKIYQNDVFFYFFKIIFEISISKWTKKIIF